MTLLPEPISSVNRSQAVTSVLHATRSAQSPEPAYASNRSSAKAPTAVPSATGNLAVAAPLPCTAPLLLPLLLPGGTLNPLPDPPLPPNVLPEGAIPGNGAPAAASGASAEIGAAAVCRGATGATRPRAGDSRLAVEGTEGALGGGWPLLPPGGNSLSKGGTSCSSDLPPALRRHVIVVLSDAASRVVASGTRFLQCIMSHTACALLHALRGSTGDNGTQQTRCGSHAWCTHHRYCSVLSTGSRGGKSPV